MITYFYPAIKSASCIVPVLDKFYVTKSNKYDYPDFVMTKKEWKKSIIRPFTLYGLTKKDIKPFIFAYYFSFINSLVKLFRLKHNIPENMTTKEYIKNKFKHR